MSLIWPENTEHKKTSWTTYYTLKIANICSTHKIIMTPMQWQFLLPRSHHQQLPFINPNHLALRRNTPCNTPPCRSIQACLPDSTVQYIHLSLSTQPAHQSIDPISYKQAKCATNNLLSSSDVCRVKAAVQLTAALLAENRIRAPWRKYPEWVFLGSW